MDIRPERPPEPTPAELVRRTHLVSARIMEQELTQAELAELASLNAKLHAWLDWWDIYGAA